MIEIKYFAEGVIFISLLVAVVCVIVRERRKLRLRRANRYPAPDGVYVSKEQAPELSRAERRRYASMYRKVKNRSLMAELWRRGE